MNKPRISLIGSGNVATHLGKALFESGYQIAQVFSKTFEKAKLLADQLAAEPINDLSEINPDTDLIFVLVKDSWMMEVLEHFTSYDTLLVHASGSVEMDVLKPFSANFGVFYPLQTFSRTRIITFKNIPVCIEANTSKNVSILSEIAKDISGNVYQMDSEQRLRLHIAAVYACNFSNYMYSIAEEFLHRNNIPFDIIKPLILETAHKAMDSSPSMVQTGPAYRGDKEILEKHTSLLHSDPKIREVYALISDLITNRHELFKKLEL